MLAAFNPALCGWRNLKLENNALAMGDVAKVLSLVKEVLVEIRSLSLSLSLSLSISLSLSLSLTLCLNVL